MVNLVLAVFAVAWLGSLFFYMVTDPTDLVFTLAVICLNIGGMT